MTSRVMRLAKQENKQDLSTNIMRLWKKEKTEKETKKEWRII